MKRGKDNIVGSIFINYGELHDYYEHSMNLDEQQTYFNEKHKEGDDFLRLPQNKAGGDNNMKIVCSFSGSETSETFK